MTRDTTAGSDGDVVLDDAQNWAARSHRELYEGVHVNNDPARVGELAQEWKRLGGELAESAQQLTERMRGTESGWQGTAGDAARSAIQQLVDWNRNAGAVVGQLGDRIASQGRIMETAKTEMPEPVEGSGDLDEQAARTYAAGDLAAFTSASTDLRTQHDRAGAAHQQAVEVMTRMEEQSRVVDRNTPRFPMPPNPFPEGTARRTPVRPDSAPAGPGAGPSASANRPASPNAQPSSASQEGQPSNGRPAGNQPAGNQSAGNQPASGRSVAPKPEPTTGGSDSQQHGAPPSSAHPQRSGENAATESGSAQPGSHGHEPTKKADVRTGSHGVGDDAAAPRPEGFQPDDTSSQSAAPTPGWSAAHTTTPSSGQDPLHTSRAVQDPDGSTATSGRPVAPWGKRGKRSGSDDSRSGRRTQVPPIPSTDLDVGPASTDVGADIDGGPADTGADDDDAGAGAAGSAGDSGQSAPDPQSGGEADVDGAAAATGVGGQFAADASGQAAGGSGHAGMTGVGAMPPGAGAAAQGRGGQEEERTAKYVEGGPVVETPGADLPPPVIGEGKKKKQGEG